MRPELSLYVVADGMGGHGNGEVASRLAALSVCDSIETLPAKSGRKPALSPPSNELRRALEAANRAVFNAVEKNDALSGMGATMVAMMFAGSTAAIAHVGDSRAYRYRDGDLERLTEDHTWVGQQVSAGELSADEARSHPFRNVVTRALGGEAQLEVELGSYDVTVGDLFLLCSDGLTAVLDDEEIAECLTRHLAGQAESTGALDFVCTSLIAAANDGGGPDNITVVAVSFTESD